HLVCGVDDLGLGQTHSHKGPDRLARAADDRPEELRPANRRERRQARPQSLHVVMHFPHRRRRGVHPGRQSAGGCREDRPHFADGCHVISVVASASRARPPSPRASGSAGWGRSLGSTSPPHPMTPSRQTRWQPIPPVVPSVSSPFRTARPG
ncbi:MAG: hypothetical protein ACK55I_40535, partial [bacterium]